MAKLTLGPVVSDARGSVAGVTFSRWKQTAYARRKTRPANPNTVSQQAIRLVFSVLNKDWQFLPTNTRDAWSQQAKGRNYADRNHFIGINSPLLLADPNYETVIFSPGMAGTVPPETVTVTGGVDTITVAATLVNVPIGFTLTSMILGIVKSTDDADPPAVIAVEFEDVAAAFTHDFTGLDVARYVGFAFPKFLAPDGSVRYGISISDFANAT